MNTHFDEIDDQRAKEIARTFLQQYHSIYALESTLEDGVWIVNAKTTSFGDIVKRVKIAAKTGRIISAE